MWVKTTSAEAGLLSAASASRDNEFVFFIRVGLLELGDQTTNLIGSVVNDGGWHHVAFVREGSTRSQYLEARLGSMEEHTHSYHTGSGEGQNNTEEETGPAVSPE